MSKWPMVALGEVITQVTDPVPVNAAEEYPNFGIYSFGRGLFAKPPISGTSSSARTLYRVQQGQFIYSRLFAFEGAYGLVSKDFDGHFVSNEYPTFSCDPKRLDVRYLAAYFRSPTTWKDAAELTSGMGDRRRRIKPDQLVKIKIPLPPLSEERRLVEWIDDVAMRVEEARRLRAEGNRAHNAIRGAAISGVLETTPFSGTLKDALLSKPRNGWSAKCDGLESGSAILSLGAVTGFEYRSDRVKRTSEPTIPDAHYWLSPGDLLITRSNTPELVGHAAVYDGNPTPCIYPDLMMRLEVDKQRFLPEFIHYVLQSRTTRTTSPRTQRAPAQR